MKKILNDPYQYVDEMLAGLCSAHPELYRQAGEAGRVIARSEKIKNGKVGIVNFVHFEQEDFLKAFFEFPLKFFKLILYIFINFWFK